MVMLGVLKGSTELASVSIEGETQAGCELTVKYELTEGFEQTEYTKFTWEYSDEEKRRIYRNFGCGRQNIYRRRGFEQKNISVQALCSATATAAAKGFIPTRCISTPLRRLLRTLKSRAVLLRAEKLTVTFDTASGAVDTEKSRVIWYWTDKKRRRT
ncbi:MAG: hypothetical protein L6V93_22660 [Clostridiales bacterium]|nr:MAG: hypothetical protein L6V93_22660 [Clostridiales bacterium]